MVTTSFVWVLDKFILSIYVVGVSGRSRRMLLRTFSTGGWHIHINRAIALYDYMFFIFSWSELLILSVDGPRKLLALGVQIS